MSHFLTEADARQMFLLVNIAAVLLAAVLQLVVVRLRDYWIGQLPVTQRQRKGAIAVCGVVVLAPLGLSIVLYGFRDTMDFVFTCWYIDWFPVMPYFYLLPTALAVTWAAWWYIGKYPSQYLHHLKGVDRYKYASTHVDARYQMYSFNFVFVDLTPVRKHPSRGLHAWCNRTV